MPNFSLDNALSSQNPSSIDPLARIRQQKEQQRLQTAAGGRRTSLFGTQRTEQSVSPEQVGHQLQQENRIDYANSPDIPPLQGTVRPIAPPESPLQVTIGTNSVTESEDSDNEITMTGSQLNVKTVNNGKDVQLKKTDYTKLKNTLASAKTKNEELKTEIGELKTEVVDKDRVIGELKQKLSKAQGNKKKGKKNERKDEQKDDVNTAIFEFMKAVLFRTVKFARPGTELKAACKTIWFGIKDNLALDEGPKALDLEEFTDIYDSKVLEYLSGRRQCVQTRGEVAAKDWYEDWGDLPTLDEVQNCWDLPEPPADDATEEDKAKYNRAVAVLTWYLDKYLAKTVGTAFWGDTIRPFHLMTDKFNIMGDNSGKKKVLVTVTSEAYALVVWANCRDKWLADFTLKKENKKAKIPKYDKANPETWKHQNKWSSSRTGQVQGGGWHPDALRFFEQCKTNISKFRQIESENDNKRLKFGQGLIKIANEIALEDAGTATGKRKRTDDPAEEEVEVVDLSFMDE